VLASRFGLGHNFKRAAWPALVMICLTSILGGILIATLTRPPRGCPATTFEATFLQLLIRDETRTEHEWRNLLERLHRQGIRTLIIQWTSAGGVYFYPGHTGPHPVAQMVPVILEAAREADQRVWIGLQEDPAWWSLQDRSDAELERYFAGRLAALEGQLPSLKALIEGGDPQTTVGWYITDEIDDTRWQSRGREEALQEYLAGMVRLLGRVDRRRPIAISAFANGAQDPHRYAAQLSRLVRISGIKRLLFQDGTGAGKRTSAEAALAARAIARSLSGSGTQFGVVVELFNLDPSKSNTEPSVTSPAPIESMVDRLAAVAGVGDLPPASFSNAHHLTELGGPEAAKREGEWTALLARCGTVVSPRQ
jgi:hypothetical protein